MRSAVTKNFFKYVSLNVLGMMALSCYVLADTFFVSNVLGNDGIAALNFAVPLFSLMNATGLMLGIGGGTLYAIQKANGEVQKSRATFTSALTVGLVLSVVYLLIGVFFSKDIAGLLGAKDGTLEHTTIYLRTILCFAPLFVINNVLIGFVRNDGAPKIAMSGMVIGSLSNVLLDYILMMPLGMGMFGAAFATGLAPLISIACMTIYFFKKQNCLRLVRFKFSIRHVLKICHLGLNSFVIEIAFGLVLIVFNLKMLELVGVEGVAAYAIVANLALVLNSLFTGVAQGIQPILSQAFAQQDKAAVRRILLYGILTVLAFFAVAYILVNALSHQIISVFNKDDVEIVYTIATQGFWLYCLGYVFAGTNIVVAQYHCATDRATKGFIIAVLRSGVCIIPMIFIMVAVGGLTGLWLSFLGAESITICVSIAFLCAKKRKKVIALSEEAIMQGDTIAKGIIEEESTLPTEQLLSAEIEGAATQSDEKTEL